MPSPSSISETKTKQRRDRMAMAVDALAGAGIDIYGMKVHADGSFELITDKMHDEVSADAEIARFTGNAA